MASPPGAASSSRRTDTQPPLSWGPGVDVEFDVDTPASLLVAGTPLSGAGPDPASEVDPPASFPVGVLVPLLHPLASGAAGWAHPWAGYRYVNASMSSCFSARLEVSPYFTELCMTSVPLNPTTTLRSGLAFCWES